MKKLKLKNPPKAKVLQSKKGRIVFVTLGILLVGIITTFTAKQLQTTRCADTACFQQKFQACQPAQVRDTWTNFSNQEIVTEWRVIGGEPDSCEVSKQTIGQHSTATVCTLDATDTHEFDPNVYPPAFGQAINDAMSDTAWYNHGKREDVFGKELKQSCHGPEVDEINVNSQ